MNPARPQAARLTPDDVTAWRARLAASREVMVPIMETGRRNVERQRNKALTLAPLADTVTVPLDFSYTEQKKSSLFFQTPEIVAEALQPQYEASVSVFTAVMNQLLGIRGVNAKAAMFEILSDLLCPVGFGVLKVGYENVQDGMKPVPTGRMIPDPQAQPPVQPGSVLGLSSPPVLQIPEMMEAPNIISETYYWRRVAPGRFRAPADFRGSDFDDAAFLAMRFEEDVPADGEGGSTASADDDALLLVAPDATTQRAGKKRRGDEVWYKAALFDADVKHPDLLRTFRVYDDDRRGTPIARRDSPFQRWVLPGQTSPSDTYVPGGTLLGMKGFPFQVFTLHYISDLAFPPAMCTMSRQIVDEIGDGRTQMVRRRKRALQQILYDTTRMTDPAVMEKIERNDNTGFIGVPGNPLEMFLPLDKGQYGRENFAFNDISARDLDQIWAMGSGGGVLKGESPETATKSNQLQAAIDTRSEADRTRVLEGYVKAVTKTAALVQVFADAEDYVRIVGPDGAKRLIAWNKDTIAGSFAFAAKPDSHVRIDAAQRRQQALQNYNQLRKDPSVNAQYLITAVANETGLDPARLYVPPQPPKEEKPSVSWALKIEDFLGPGAPIAVEIAKQVGVVISPEALQMSQQLGAMAAAMLQQQAAQQAAAAGSPNGQSAHGGAADQTEPINKHNEQVTGGTPGVGVM
ncbi:MAG TPA: hypothetical protein VGJ80_06310 [Gemmatimonadales bacterium]|jgi:hypothetical protein